MPGSLDRCVAWAKAHPHPELRDKTIWEVFEEERPSLVPYVGPFDGFHAVPASVSKTCLVRFDKNRYSVDARAVGRPVEIRAYAERIEIWQDGRSSASTPRLRARQGDLRPACITSRCWPASPAPPQRRALQGLGPAAGDAARSAQAGRVARRRPADGRHPRRRADRRAGCRRSRLRRGAGTTTSIPPASCSTSWPGIANRRRP
jgi:hypothetical protein